MAGLPPLMAAVVPGEGHNVDAKAQINDAVQNSMRAQGKWNKEKKRKYNMYKEEYKKSVTPAEQFTKPTDHLDTALVPDALKGTVQKAIGTGAVYPTSSIARDDKKRITFGVAAKGNLTNPLNVYSEDDITIVELKHADQYFGNVDVPLISRVPAADYNGIQEVGGNATARIPFLKGVTTFLPLLAPPRDKNMSDYLNDVNRLGLGTKSTAIQQALGQAVSRAAFTTKQLTLNQSFMLTEADFYRMSSKASAEPMATIKEPRVAMFYKKFIDCDDAISSTIPGGTEHYNSIAGTIDGVESLMKNFLSTPAFGDRYELLALGTENKDVNEAFQNLQIHEDVFEMIKHTMYSTYINLITSIAEIYMVGKKWDQSCNIGVYSGFPPGLIMPCHLNEMISDNLFTSGLHLAVNNVDLEHVEHLPGTPALGQTKLDAMYAQQNPHFRAIFNMKRAFVFPFSNATPRVNRLFQDGTEWLNAQTPNVQTMVTAKNNGVVIGTNATNLTNFLKSVNGSIINSNSLILNYNVSAAQEGIVSGNNQAEIVAAMLNNAAIYDAMLPYIQPSQSPTGTMLFSQWGLTQDKIMNVRSGGGSKYDKKRAGAAITLEEFRGVKALRNSNFGPGGPPIFKQGVGGAIKFG